MIRAKSPEMAKPGIAEARRDGWEGAGGNGNWLPTTAEDGGLPGRPALGGGVKSVVIARRGPND